MALHDIKISPGVFSDNTDRDISRLGFWKSADKVRFFSGQPTKIGGWNRGAADPQFLGYARGSVDWRTTRSELLLGVGTHLKLYVWSGGTYSDITPLRLSGTLADPFSTTDTSPIVSVAHVAHGLAVGDYVIFSGAAAVGGVTVLGTYTVTAITTASIYTITHTSNATSTAGPGGGAAVAYDYEIPVGSVDAVEGLGWGTGAWGVSTWGTARTVAAALSTLRTWQMDRWGEDIVCCPRGGGLYVFDSSLGLTTRATIISNAPITAKGVLVSPEDRHLIALGAHDGTSSDPLRVSWCSSEDYTDWTPSLTNTAGSKRLDLGSEIICGERVRGEHLIFTDSSIVSMTFVGPPDTFSFRTLGDNGNLAGPMAVHVFEGVAYWMGDQDFFMYDGVTKVVPCTLRMAVFDDLNRNQKHKVHCGVNRDYREVWWLYPSASSDECDRYAIYDMTQKSWTSGTLSRTMLVGDSDVFNYSYGFSGDGYIYEHETGTDDYLTAMDAYIESGDIELSVEQDTSGNAMAHMGKMIPDFRVLAGSVNVTVSGKRYPQDAESQTSGPHNITATTKFINPRMRARQISIRLDSTGLGDDWRAGTLRVDLMPHGGR